MKKTLRLLFLVGLCGSLFLAGCSLRVYGVPKEEWQRMTPAEQQQVREAYMERRQLAEERRLYEAKQRALQAELEAQRAREAELQASRKAQIEASHRPTRPERVVAPGIIHFTLEGGTVYVAGRHRPFQPVTVPLRSGESKTVLLQTTDGRKSYRVQFVCTYEGGTLSLSNGKSRVHAQQFAYDRQWHQGLRYRDLTLGGGVGLRGASLRVASGAIPAKPSPHPQEQQGPHKPDSAAVSSALGNRKDMAANGAAAKLESHTNHPIKPAAVITAPGNSDNRNQKKELKQQRNQAKPVNSAAAITAPGNSGNQEHSQRKKPEKEESHSQPPQSASSHSGKPQHPAAAMADSKNKAKKDEHDGKVCAAAESKKGDPVECEDALLSKAKAKGKPD